jgi:hypothetical protein
MNLVIEIRKEKMHGLDTYLIVVNRVILSSHLSEASAQSKAKRLLGSWTNGKAKQAYEAKMTYLKELSA